MYIFLLYNGNTADGTGEGEFCGLITSMAEAQSHYLNVLSNPYNVGGVEFYYGLGNNKDVGTVIFRKGGYDSDWVKVERIISYYQHVKDSKKFML